MKIRERIARTVLKSIGYGTDSSVGWLELFNSDGKRSQGDYIKEYRRIVYACVSAISEEVGNYRPMITKPLASGELQEVKDHQFLRVLDNPNRYMSKYDLFEHTQSYIELAGECFWYLALGEATGKPKEIYTIRPDYVKVVVDRGTGDILSYEVNRPDGQRIPLELNEILHFKMFNPENRYRGLGTVQAGIDYVETEKYATKFTRNFLYNNATPPGILTLNGKIGKTAYNKFKKQWRERIAGVDNAGKIAIIRGADADFKKVGVSIADMDLKGLRELTEDAILKMFRVPKPLLGGQQESGLGRAEVDSLEYIFSKRVIEPKMNRIDDILQFALDRFYGGQGLKLEHKTVVPADRTALLEEHKAGVDIWLTRNEIRKEQGRDPIMGGSDLFQQLNQVPVEGRPDAVQATKSLKKAGTITVVKKAIKKEAPEVSQKAKENFRLLLVATQKAYERAYLRKVRSLLNAQLKKLTGNLANQKALPALKQKAFDDILMRLEDEREEFIKGLEPIISELLDKAASIALRFAGTPDLEFQKTEAIQAAVRDSLARMSDQFNRDTIAALTSTLSQGVAAGESVSKLSQRVADVYKQAKGFRSDRVARTETLKASNYAADMAYQQSGVVVAKQWFANPDACEFCAEMDGKIVQLEREFLSQGDSVSGADGAEYIADYESIEDPPLHPNCECTILPVRL